MAIDHAAWQDQEHAREFDALSTFPDFLLQKRFESYNEVRLLRAHLPAIKGGRLYEVGCATGEFYRYAKLALAGFEYEGFDVSEPALARAREKYGPARFHRLSGGVEEISAGWRRPAVVFCRDVVLHHPRPLEFLRDLVGLAEEGVALRLRTRDAGRTLWDPEQSCQWHYGRYWVPYIVINVEELVSYLKSLSFVAKIVISRRYEALGGHTGRHLPKELFDPKSGSAETAVWIGKGPGSTAVEFDDAPDGPRFSLLERAILRAARKLRR